MIQTSLLHGHFLPVPKVSVSERADCISLLIGIETINTFIHSRSFLENHTRFQTKMDEVYTAVYSRFQTQTAAKPYPLRRHMAVWLI